MADARTSRPGVIVTMAQAQDSAEAAREPTMPTNARPGPAASLLSMDIRRGPPTPVEPEPAELAVEPEPTEPAIAPEPEPPPSPQPPSPQPQAPPQAPPQRPSDITAYWRQLKNGRHLPSWSDLDSKLIADCWPNSMLLSCGAETQRLTLDSLFTQALRVENHGADGDRTEGIDFTPMLTEWVLSLGREAGRFGKPMQDTDALPSDSGEVRYRVIALPLSDDQQRIDHVLCHVDRA